MRRAPDAKVDVEELPHRSTGSSVDIRLSPVESCLLPTSQWVDAKPDGEVAGPNAIHSWAKYDQLMRDSRYESVVIDADHLDHMESLSPRSTLSTCSWSMALTRRESLYQADRPSKDLRPAGHINTSYGGLSHQCCKMRSSHYATQAPTSTLLPLVVKAVTSA